jgi:hypothetical protein
MSVRVNQSTQVNVNVTERSVTYMTNAVFQLFFRILRSRGLGPEYLLSNREVIDSGLFTWLSEQTLLKAFLEVYMPGRDEALERWDFTFDYSSRVRGDPAPPPVAEVEALCARIASLPRRAAYRVVVRTAPGATRVPGWAPTRLRLLAQSGGQAFTAYGLDGLSASLVFRSGGGGMAMEVQT